MAEAEKTEKASPKKREDEQKKGNIFQSRDAASALSVLLVFSVMRALFPKGYEFMAGVMTRFFGYTGTVDELTVNGAVRLLAGGVTAVLLVAGPVVLCAMFTGVLASGAQTRFRVSRENIRFKFSRINPLEGIRRLFSLRSLVELLKAAAKLAVIAVVLIQSLAGLVDTLPSLMDQGVEQGVRYILVTLYDIVMKMSMAFLAIAVADFGYQWWQYEKNIRMTKQEVKEEYRQMEGDPQVKSQIKERQRAMAMRRMMQQVPKADVVVKNPTHFAVALAYDINKSNAPVVLAKGQDYMALRILAIAEEYGIPTTENRPLARELYRRVEPGREIPPEFYTVMAEIMAWVYSVRKEKPRF